MNLAVVEAQIQGHRHLQWEENENGYLANLYAFMSWPDLTLSLWVYVFLSCGAKDLQEMTVSNPFKGQKTGR